MFALGRFYKHRNMRDVCFSVIRRTYQDADRIKVKIEWYLDRGVQLFSMDLSEEITIDRKQVRNYHEVL